MNEKTKQNPIEAGRQDLIDTYEISISGYAGILPNGDIVDRRLHPGAIAIEENKLLRVPKPKEIKP